MKYSLPELSYDYSALEPHYSARLLELHHAKHHAGYVTGANAALEKLGGARAEGDFAAINQLQKSLAFHLSGHVLHSLLWKNLSPKGGGEPDGELAAAVDEFFGSFEGLVGQMSEAALNVQGSGWGALGWEPQESWFLARYELGRLYEDRGDTAHATQYYQELIDLWNNGDSDLVILADARRRLLALQPAD